MHYLLRLVSVLAWALWLGGLIALFLFVTVLFKEERSTAVVAAPLMFARFERFQLLLAAVALLAVGGLRLIEPRAIHSVVFTFFAVATLALVISATLIRPKMERLRVAGESSGPQFRQMHGQSMGLYSLQAAALALAGLFIPAAMNRPQVKPTAAPPTPQPTPRPQTTPPVAPPTAPPA
jgi:Domain of unknown function (DUF4149)